MRWPGSLITTFCSQSPSSNGNSVIAHLVIPNKCSKKQQKSQKFSKSSNPIPMYFPFLFIVFTSLFRRLSFV